MEKEAVALLDHDLLLRFATELGYCLQVSGGEIYRVEETVRRVLAAYGAPDGEVFAIPNCLTVSLTEPGGHALTRIRRVGHHGTDIYRLEALNQLSREVCGTLPPLPDAMACLEAICADRTLYSHRLQLLAYAVGPAAFVPFFGGGWRDTLCGGVCGLVIGLCDLFLERLGTNPFFRTAAGAFFSALMALALVGVGFGVHADTIIIGALMALVPGIAFTNSMRDIIAGDLVAGITKSAESLLIGVTIALGTGAALWAARLLGVTV